MKPMTKCLDFNLRTGRTVNINDTLDMIEGAYKGALDATISCLDTYDDVSMETFNDELIIKAELNLLEKLGYIDVEELQNMVTLASDIRKQKLEELNKKEGEN